MYEERIDIQKARIVSKARERSAIEKRKSESINISSPTNGGGGSVDSDEAVGDSPDMPRLVKRRGGNYIQSSDESMPFSDDSSDSEEDDDNSEDDEEDNNDDSDNGDLEQPLLQVNQDSSSDSEDEDQIMEDAREE